MNFFAANFRENKVFAKSLELFCYFAIIFAVIFNNFSLHHDLAANQYAQTKVYYSKTSQPDLELVRAIQDADKYVYFAIYTVTKENIANALIAAKLRGLDVRGVMDYKQTLIDQEKPRLSKFKKYGIEIKVPFKLDGLMHIKMLVTDKAYASGSFNWTVAAATYNDDILEIGEVQGIRNQYLQAFWDLWARS